MLPLAAGRCTKPSTPDSNIGAARRACATLLDRCARPRPPPAPTPRLLTLDARTPGVGRFTARPLDEKRTRVSVRFVDEVLLTCEATFVEVLYAAPR